MNEFADNILPIIVMVTPLVVCLLCLLEYEFGFSSLIIGSFLRDMNDEYESLIADMKQNPDTWSYNTFEVRKNGVRFWVANNYYGFTRDIDRKIPFLYKRRLYNAVQNVIEKVTLQLYKEQR